MPKEWTDGAMMEKDVKINESDRKKSPWSAKNNEEESIKNHKEALYDLQKLTEQVSASFSDFKKSISDFESSIPKRNAEIETLQCQLAEPKNLGIFNTAIRYKIDNEKKIDSWTINSTTKKLEDAGKENKSSNKETEFDPVILELSQRQRAAYAEMQKKQGSVP